MRVPSTIIQNNFGKYLKFAEAGEEIIVTKNGKEMAKVTRYLDTYTVKEKQPEYRPSDGKVTYEEFLELTEESEQRFELIDGAIYNLASPSYKHQHAIGELFGTFYIGLKGRDCVPLTSPFDITLTKETGKINVVQPDIVVICDPDNLDEKDRYLGIPKLVIEVLSPTTRNKDMLTKLDLYKQCGIQEYWIVDTVNEQVLVYILDNNDIIDMKVYIKSAHKQVSSNVFPSLEVDLQTVFT